MPTITLVIPPFPCPIRTRKECRGARCNLFEQSLEGIIHEGLSPKFAKDCVTSASAYKQILENNDIIQYR